MISRSAFVRELAKRLGVTRAEASDILGTVLGLIIENLGRGDGVYLKGFGRFKTIHKETPKVGVVKDIPTENGPWRVKFVFSNDAIKTVREQLQKNEEAGSKFFEV